VAIRVTLSILSLGMLLACSPSTPPDHTEDRGLSGRLGSVLNSSSEDVENDTSMVPPEPMRIGGDVSAPRVISRVEPDLPSYAGQCFEQGIAVFEAIVDEHGTVRDLKLTHGPENEFTRRMMDAVAKWRFEPGTHRGEPVPVIFNVTVNHVPIRKIPGPC
jgi:hypothetical protein